MSKFIDLTGQDFGYWHVIKRIENRTKSGHTRWLCKCTACGNEKEVDGGHLRSGRTTNCGCIRIQKMRQANIKDRTGQVYGFLYVNRIATLEEYPRKDKQGTYWNCTCLKCGRKNVIVWGDYLQKGDTKSCGCINSINESKIAQILDNLKISYKTQYRFKNLTSTGRECDQLMFDFAIFNNNKLIYLIEYDGIQHFEEGHFHNSLEKTRKNDLIKNKYCFDNNILIIRIPYDAEYTIDDLKLETTRFLLTPENEEDYYMKRGK